jgi:hypothetical protein
MSASPVFTVFTSDSFSPTVEIDGAALDVGQARCVLQYNAVIAVRIITDDDRAGILAARRGDGQRVHVGDGHSVELARVELVNRFDIVVDLHDVDLDAVFVRPFLHDPGLLRIGPWHPPGIDRPADREIRSRRSILLLIAAARGGQQQRDRGTGDAGVLDRVRHHILPRCSREDVIGLCGLCRRYYVCAIG